MIRFAHILLVLVTLAAYLPPYIDPDTFWPIATLGLLAPTLWLLLLTFGVYWVFRRDKAVLLTIVTLLLGWEMMSNAFALSSSKPIAAEQTISVLSLNGKGFDQEEAVAFFRNQSADIYLFQEFPRYRSLELTPALKEVLDLSYTYQDPDGQLAIFSRFPLKNTQTQYFDNRTNGYQTVEVTTPNGDWTLVNVHLQTNAISNLANEVTQESDLREKQTWKKIKTMFGRYARSNQLRTRQAAAILDVVNTATNPTIVAGDFNDVPTSYLYRQMHNALKDAHLEQSWGLGTTFAGLLPGLRIDYILPQPVFSIHEFERIDCDFSDHRAIQVVLSK